MHNTIRDNPEKYIVPNPQLLPMLSQLQTSGKRLFLLTNSSFDYINSGMNYLLGKEWRDLFEFVFCSGDKPNFFALDNVCLYT